MNALNELRDFLPDDQSAVLVTSEVNRRYLSGFPSSAGAVLATKSRCMLLLDFRYYEAAAKRAQPPLEVYKYTRLIDDLNNIFLKENIQHVYIEDETVTVASYHEMQEAFIPSVRTDGLSEKLNELRMCKSEPEIEKIITAQRIAERSYTEALNLLRPGVSERSVAVELEHLIKLYGGERAAFELICVTGENTALPHGVPTDKVVQKGDFFTFDIGAVYEGYHSDMTRTVAVGYADEEMRRVYDIVLQAHRKAERAIKSGNKAADADIAAREHIEACGFGKYFGHSTGHGVGLEIHEAPAVYKTNHTVLRDNMVITDEPGIYLPGRFGVRIEDMYLVRGDKAEDLAQITKELVVV